MSDAAPAHARHDRLDALRGAAIVWMVVFHFCFDLNHFGFIRQEFLRDPFWTGQRTAIVSLFLFCAGLGQSVALQQGQGWRRFWRRWAQVAGCALLVTAGSWWMFPRSFIFFGVLHGVAVMLVLVRLLAPLGWRLLLPLGVLSIALPWWVAHPIFDAPATVWLGLGTRKPVTEDFVPVFPWLGAVCLGLVAGGWLQRHRPSWLAGGLPGRLAPLALLGRWPLTVYMLHQPLLIALVGGAAALRG
jgi:uncharacterized membrane protein